MATKTTDPADKPARPEKPLTVKKDYHAEVIAALALYASHDDFLVFDLETTTKNFNKDERVGDAVGDGRVMQIAATAWHRIGGDRFEQVDKLNVLVREPTVTLDEHIHPAALKTHKIQASFLWEKDSTGRYVWPTPQDAWKRLTGMAKGRVLVGQNIVTFDIPLANREMAHWGLAARLDTANALDTLPVARQLFDLSHFQIAEFDAKTGAAIMPASSGHKMANIATRLGLKFDPDKLHDALYDIDLCWRVWIAMLPKLRDYAKRVTEENPSQYRSRVGGIDRSLLGR